MSVMSANLATESTTVQNPLVRYAGEIGWEIVPQSEAVILRKGDRIAHAFQSANHIIHILWRDDARV
jgi:hypothetical protein